MKDSRKDLGRKGETFAEVYLRKKGFRTLAKNFHCPLGEVDLIMMDGETTVFIEVKSGKHSAAFSPIHHFDAKKQKKLIQLAKYYLSRSVTPKDARIDLVVVQRKKAGFQAEHFENAVEDSLG